MLIYRGNKCLELCVSEDSLTFVWKLSGPDELVAEQHKNVADSLNISAEDRYVRGGLIDEQIVLFYVISVRLNINSSVVCLDSRVSDIVFEVLEILNVVVVSGLQAVVLGPNRINSESDGLDSDHSVGSKIDSVSELLISQEDFT